MDVVRLAPRWSLARPRWLHACLASRKLRLTACSCPAVRRKTSGLPPDVVGKVDHDGCRGAAHDHPAKRLQLRGVDFHMEQESRNVNEVAGLRVRYEFTSCTPANLADAGEHIGDRLLLSMMVNSGPRSRFDLEQAAPDGKSNAQRRCDSLATFGARRLRGSEVEFRWADDVDCSRRAHGVPNQFGSSTGELSSA